MSARQIAISNALQELEPDVMDLARMAHLVASLVGDLVDAGDAQCAGDDMEAISFGVFQLRKLTAELRDAYQAAFRSAPPA